jgi:hypothetical protein
MRGHLSIVSVAIAAGFVVAGDSVAKDHKASDAVRDGTTQARAIIVTEPESTYVHWEYQYLDKHFPGRTFPMEHALVGDKSDERAWDLHTFMWRGKKTEVWFDITKQFQDFSRRRAKPK